MPLVLANRVQETGTANTTVSFTLAGAVTGFQSFAVIGNTNTTYYSATDGSGNWEVGLGTYSTTGPTLARTTVYASSNSGSAVTFSGAVNVFVTYPSGRSVNLNESGNVSALGTVSSGTWQGSTVGVAYGGTGVTTSSGPNSVVLRDANENITVNRLSQGLQTITASGGVTTLTAASDFNQQLVGTGGHTFRLPDATTLTDTTTFQFNNNATGTLTIQNNAATTVGTVAPGGAAGIALMNNSTSGGTWDVHGYIPESVTWGTNALALGSTVITGGTWNGGTITPAYGGTGLTSFTTNGAVYATGTTTLTSGTLPVISGGTGTVSVPTNGQLLIGNGSTYTVASLGTGTGISTTVGSGTLTINNTGVTSLAGTSPVTASASTGSVTMSLASGYGDTQNPYASKTANFFLAAPNGSAGAPTFRAVVAADIPTLNQNTTGSAGSVTNAVTFNNGGTGDASGTTFNGSAARTISYNTVGAPSTGGANATGTWGISITGNAATATTASNVNNGTLSMGVSGTGLSGSASFTANQSGNSTFTVTSNATNANTASTIVARDASGNFSAGTITATLSGSATSAGSVSNSVTFNNGGAGGASGSTFNGSGALTVSHNTIGASPLAGSTSITTLGTIGTGTWQGSIINSTYGGTGVNNAGRTLAVNTNSGSLTFSNASTTLTVANNASVSGTNTGDQTITLTGDVTGSGAGSFATTLATVNSNIGTFNNVTVNAKGLVTAASNAAYITSTISGTMTAGNFADSFGSYNVNLGSGGTEGRGAVAGYSGGSYGGVGYNIRHTATSNTYIAPGSDTASYIRFDTGGFTFLGAPAGSAGRTLSLTSLATLTSGGAFTATSFSGAGTGLTGTASSLSIGGNAATITSQANSATITASTTATANQIVLRDGGGDDNRRYGFASYFNSSDDVSGGTITYIMAKFGDNYYRSATAAKVASFISGQTMNINGSSTSCSGNAATATSATTATNVAGGAANRIVYNTAAGTSAFVVAPTVSSTYLSWNGSAFAWAAVSGGVTVSDDNSTNATRYLTFTSATSGSISTVNVSSTKLTYNPSTGALTSTSHVSSSDARLKTNWRDLPDNLVEQLAQVKAGVYDRTDTDEPVTQVGVSAQSLQDVIPNAVVEDVDGMLSVAYGNAALVAAIELAKRVVEQEARINRLEAMMAKLIGD